MKIFGTFVILVSILILAAIITFIVFLVNDDPESRTPSEADELFELSIIHINDFHARFEETNERSFPCQEGENCIGGIARVKTVVDNLKQKRKNSIFLNAGDNFQGTFWCNLLQHNVTSHFLNLIPADAMTIGNHEFTRRVAGLVSLLKLLTFPVVVTNIDDKFEPSIQSLYKKSLIIEKNGRKIGILGVILKETPEIASTDKLKFLDEVTAIRDESTTLRQKGVNIIIVISHCGLNRDVEIAKETGDFVDVIVGGHSHSFLFTSQDEKSPGPDTPVDTYPLVVTPKSRNDRKTLVVQASAFTKYVGDLTVFFNSAGHVKFFSGNPIFLGNEVSKSPEIEKELIPWREEVERVGGRLVGQTKINLLNEGCRAGECLLGSFSADAFLHETQLAFRDIQVFASIIQSAGIRSSFPRGDVTYGDIVALMPWENTVDIVELPGTILLDAFEHSVSRSFVENDFIGVHMLQVSGFHITFNTTKPVGERLRNIQIRTSQFGNYEEINPHELYKIVIPSFIAGGGDGFTMIRANRKSHQVGLLDVDVMEKFIARNSPIGFQSTGRIVMLQ